MFTPLGEDGEMTPTMYWAIGNYIPLPIQGGRYWTFYQFGVFLERGACPEDYRQRPLGVLVRQRRLVPLPPRLDEAGPQGPLHGAYGENVDMEEHAKKQIKRLIEFARKAGYTPVFWDSMRVIDLVARGGSEEFGNEKWAEKFRIDKVGTAREYLEKVLDAYSEMLGGVEWRL